MKKSNCIIIEDEPIASGILLDYIAQVPFLNVVGNYRSAVEAMQVLNATEVDLLFLDIHLPVIRGLDFLKSISKPRHTIITSAYHQYAVDGFELNITDYLLKPYSFDRFLKAIARIDIATNTKNIETTEPSRGHIFVTSNKRQVKVPFSDIRYVEARKEYVVIHTDLSSIKSKMRLSVLEQMLPKTLFQRTHRSFIVSINHLTSFDQSFVEIPDKYIPIGKSYREDFTKAVGSFSYCN